MTNWTEVTTQDLIADIRRGADRGWDAHAEGAAREYERRAGRGKAALWGAPAPAAWPLVLDGRHCVATLVTSPGALHYRGGQARHTRFPCSRLGDDVRELLLVQDEAGRFVSLVDLDGDELAVNPREQTALVRLTTRDVEPEVLAAARDFCDAVPHPLPHPVGE